MHLRVVIAATAIAASVCVAPTASARPHPVAPVVATASQPLRVLLVGDSLTRQARAVFTGTIVASGRATVDGTLVYSGTALCNWFPALEPKLQTFRPQVAVVEFLGNNFGTCMQDPKTGTQVTGAALVARYRADTKTAMRLFSKYGVTVYWVAPPLTRGQKKRPLAPVYRHVARVWRNAHFVDAGAAVEDHGSYTDFLPCLPSEPCTGVNPATGKPAAQVRSPDGVHFCPVGKVFDCPVWSSGAWRFGRAMAAPVVHDYQL